VTELLIGFGSNLGERRTNICRAVKKLENTGPRLVRLSSLYETEPYGYTEQNWFMNCVGLYEYSGNPSILIHNTLKIEQEIGRSRTRKWGPRIIDIDILVYGDLVIESEKLRIPHYDIRNRLFVLLPLLEILPEAVDPESGRPFSSFLPEEVSEKCIRVETPFVCENQVSDTAE